MNPVDNTPRLEPGIDLIKRITALEEKLIRLKDTYDDLADKYCDLYQAGGTSSK